jgi:hypothetical protein
MLGAKITRRRFLGAAVAGGAWIVLGGAVGCARSPRQGRRHKPQEGPLDGPDATLRGRYGRVDGPVGVAVFVVPVVVAMFFVVRHGSDSTAACLMHQSA